jgi:formylglycine-generating enzyme required for sulfatase activity
VFDGSGKRLGAVGATLSLPPFVSHELTVTAARHKPAEVTVRIDRPGADAGTRQVVLEEQGLPPDLIEVADAQYAPLDGLAPGSREAQDRQRRAVSELGFPLEARTRRTGIVLRLIPAGSFTMGSPSGEANRYKDETEHQVTLTRAFYCGKCEVTQGQWEQVIGSNPSTNQEGCVLREGGLFSRAERIEEDRGDCPVETVGWSDCQAFVKKLCQMEGVPEGTYRLLTEAEWEYACRAGTQTAFCHGDTLDWKRPDVDVHYPYGGATQGKYIHVPVKVGIFHPNAWGLHDMHGNVFEWCQDLYGEYSSSNVTNPRSASSGDSRVCRGGIWTFYSGYGRSAQRAATRPDERNGNRGLRIARTAPSQP